MTKEELTKLIQQAINGDSAAFEQVVATKAEQITYMSIKMMRNRHDGEDAAQETMLKMYQHIHGLESPKAFNRWTYQITFRTCIDMMRRQSRDDHDFLELMDDLNEMKKEFLPQEYIEDVDKRQFLMKVIEDLPEYYRACLLLCYFENLSYREVASALGTTEKMVTNTIYRAKQKIRKKLEAEYGSLNELLAFSGMTAAPVLTQAFRLDAAQLVTQESIANILSGLGGSIAVLTAAAQSTAGTTAGAGTAAVSAKALVGVTVALTVAAGVTLAVLPGSGQIVTSPDEVIAQEAFAILSLEDMIGQEPADRLRSYERGEGDWSQWNTFLEEISANPVSGIVMSSGEYTLYHLEKQDKQLMILEAAGAAGSGEIQVVFRFTDSHEQQPKEEALLESMEGWRQ